MTTTHPTEPHGPKVKNPYVGNVRWAFMRWADIESAFFPGYVYLRRLRIFQTPWFALYLHFIYEADLDRDPHDHPCNFWSMIIRGGYTEKVYDVSDLLDYNFLARTHKWRRGSVHPMPVSRAHQITDLTPGTITLCWFGRRQRRWGFWTSAGFVGSDDYARTGTAPDPFGA